MQMLLVRQLLVAREISISFLGRQRLVVRRRVDHHLKVERVDRRQRVEKVNRRHCLRAERVRRRQVLVVFLRKRLQPRRDSQCSRAGFAHYKRKNQCMYSMRLLIN